MDVASSLKALVFAADIPAAERPVNHAVNVEQTLNRSCYVQLNAANLIFASLPG